MTTQMATQMATQMVAHILSDAIVVDGHTLPVVEHIPSVVDQVEYASDQVDCEVVPPGILLEVTESY